MAANIRNGVAVLDAHLENRPFIAGDALTLADIDIAAVFPIPTGRRALRRIPSPGRLAGAPAPDRAGMAADARDEVEQRMGAALQATR
ncbi:glutathione binding-like protein [Bordetella ansorpii]|uniref:glutathione binding-like protein n=1 Tax=Bordetella ansorpii TaxID=288768 RepID=UPI0012E8C38D|nr:glutathione binding-like protein [Bordetella ansorpii]